MSLVYSVTYSSGLSQYNLTSDNGLVVSERVSYSCKLSLSPIENFNFNNVPNQDDLKGRSEIKNRPGINLILTTDQIVTSIEQSSIKQSSINQSSINQSSINQSSI